MRINAEANRPTDHRGGADDRITRAGTFLRKYKLDELPQFINVVCGDMSIVGPRPEVPRFVALYPAHLRELVLSVRPGITDQASIEFRDENALLGTSSNPEATYVEQIMPIKCCPMRRAFRDPCYLEDWLLLFRGYFHRPLGTGRSESIEAAKAY